MDIILLEKVANLGELGDRVSVRNGYGRNYLIPAGRAVAATAENLEKFEARRAELERAAGEKKMVADRLAGQLADLTVTIPQRAGEEGKLFGSVGTRDIADAIVAAGIEVERAAIRLPEGAIRQVGEYQIGVHLHAEVDAEVSVVVIPE